MPETLQRVMLVEDDENITFVTVMALEDLGGFEVRHCENGQIAVDCFDAFAPQIVLMDVMMPIMDGPDTLRNLKKKPKAQNVPVVFMTAKAQTHEQQAYMGLGAVGIIVKPFDPVTLSDQVRDFWRAAGTP